MDFIGSVNGLAIKLLICEDGDNLMLQAQLFEIVKLLLHFNLARALNLRVKCKITR